MSLKETIQSEMKEAMRAKDDARRDAIRLITAAIKDKEVNERISVDDEQVLSLLAKMRKQRKDSIVQYQKGDRQDLVEKEQFEIDVIEGFMPAAMDAAELGEHIKAAISESGAESIRDMGKVMNILRPKLQGRADMGEVSALVKKQLSS